MFNKQKDLSVVNATNNPFVQTMRGDLEALAGSTSSQSKTFEMKPLDNELQAGFTPASDQSLPIRETNINASSPFSKSFSPENSASMVAPAPADQNSRPAAAVPAQNPKQIMTPLASKNPPQSHGKLILIILFSVLVLLLLAGGYFFWLTRSSKPEELPAAATEQLPTTPAVEETVRVNPLSEKYSVENPNFLSLDTNAVTIDDIKRLLLTTGEEISAAGLTKPVEFIVTDINNNPIALHIFANLAKIDFPPSLMSNLGDTFSLYFYLDSGQIHIGLVMKSKEKTTTATEIKNVEEKLPSYLDILLLGNVPDGTQFIFNNGSYETAAIRYVNLKADGSLSLDYTIDENSLLIGTSKNTLRAIIDKESDVASPIVPTAPLSPEIQNTAPNDPSMVLPIEAQKDPIITPSL